MTNIPAISINEAELVLKQRVVLEPAGEGELCPPEYTDEALALRFADHHAAVLRYVAAWGRWFIWDGKKWARDETLMAFNFARKICRDAANECPDARIACRIASAATVAAVERLARSDRRLAATVDQWDSDNWVLNTPEGVVDLRTGILRKHDPEEYLTKITQVGPHGSSTAWAKFLDRVTNHDRDLQSYLQRVAGYVLTGDTAEHALFFCYGTGANGKSVLIETIAGMLGDYQKTAPIETFTASSSDRHPTELAGLRGARLVSAVETEEGRRWAESRIKQLTGGDRIAARFMRQDFFEYDPQFKLIIAGNHKPGLRSVDEAIRRRFNLIPFTVTIPAAERDLALKNKLREEWPAILAWAVEGCLMWQKQGLGPPKVVLAATDAYLASEDTVAAWIEECCVRDPDGWESQGDLYASYKAWAEKAGEFAGLRKTFTTKLETRGFSEQRKNMGRGYRGYNLIQSSSLHWGNA